jgi:hypothetical protein
VKVRRDSGQKRESKYFAISVKNGSGSICTVAKTDSEILQKMSPCGYLDLSTDHLSAMGLSMFRSVGNFSSE